MPCQVDETRGHGCICICIQCMATQNQQGSCELGQKPALNSVQLADAVPGLGLVLGLGLAPVSRLPLAWGWLLERHEVQMLAQGQVSGGEGAGLCAMVLGHADKR